MGLYDEDEIFMKLAIEKAHEGIKNGQAPFGTCIVKDGKVLAAAYNTVWENKDITAHAEINAIREACRKLKDVSLSGCTIYTTCEPCPMCFSACHWARIKRIVYGASIEDSKKFGFNEIILSNEIMRQLGESSVKITKGVLRKECIELFEIWYRRDDRKTY